MISRRLITVVSGIAGARDGGRGYSLEVIPAGIENCSCDRHPVGAVTATITTSSNRMMTPQRTFPVIRMPVIGFISFKNRLIVIFLVSVLDGE